MTHHFQKESPLAGGWSRSAARAARRLAREREEADRAERTRKANAPLPSEPLPLVDSPPSGRVSLSLGGHARTRWAKAALLATAHLE